MKSSIVIGVIIGIQSKSPVRHLGQNAKMWMKKPLCKLCRMRTTQPLHNYSIQMEIPEMMTCLLAHLADW